MEKKTNITFKSWPEKIKKDFFGMITGVFNRLIDNFKKSYNSLEKNIQEKLQQLYQFSYSFQKENSEDTELCNSIDEYQLFVFSNILHIKDISFSAFKMAKNALFPIKDSSNNHSTKSVITDFFKGDWKKFNSQISCILFTATSFVSAYQAYTDFKNVEKEFSKIEIYRKDFKKIDDSFINNKKKYKSINYSNPPKEVYNDLEVIKNSFEENLKDIIDLIGKIELEIKESNEIIDKKEKEMIMNVIQAGIGVVGCIATKGLLRFGYGTSTIANATSYYFNKNTIDKIKEKINNLKDILEKAKKEKTQIKNAMKDIENQYGNFFTIYKNILPQFIEK